MFSLDDIHQAHAKVKSGADFPAYITDLIALGVQAYDTYVADGRTCFFGANDFEISSEAKYPDIPVAEQSRTTQFKAYLSLHQQGDTDYPTFCKHAGECGVEKWRVDLLAKRCLYFDKAGSLMLEELIGV